MLLKVDLDAKLNDAGISCRCDRSKSGSPQDRVGRIERWRIGQVEYLSAKFDIYLLSDISPFD